jgi:very-short-patch-repair endonuclease/Zn finger protein HypA/HybF involved in hydrogenase expression
MSKKKTIEEVQNEIDLLNLDFKIIDYKGNIKSNKFKHSCGHEFETRLTHLLSRRKCPKCHGKWRDKEMFQKKSNEVHKSEYEILEFSNGNSPVKIRHRICGNIFKQVGYRHLRGDGCFECYGSKKLSRDEIIKRSNEKWNKEYEILSQKVDYNKKSKLRHKVCGFEYEQVISSHLLGYGCPKCAGNAKHDKNSIQEKSDKVHNKEYLILSDVKNTKSLIKIRHIECGKEYTQKVDYHISGRMCPYCSLSKGEKIIEKILNSLNIKYERQKTFDGCKYKNKLRFDFYIPEQDTCIEYDGIQHFESCWYFGGIKALNLQKIKDQIKNEYCDKNSIKLIRFKFDANENNILDTLSNLVA